MDDHAYLRKHTVVSELKERTAQIILEKKEL